MYKFKGRTYKSPKTILKVKSNLLNEVNDTIDEIKSYMKRNKKNMKNIEVYNNILTKIKNERKALKQDILMLENEKKKVLDQVVKAKQFKKQYRNEFKNYILRNDLISDSTRKSSESRRKERFGELDNTRIVEHMRTKHRREHLRGLGDAFKEIYFHDDVNDNEKMRRTLNQKIQKELIESNKKKKSLHVHMEIMYEMTTKEGEIVTRYYRNLLHSVPSMNVINTIINDFYEGYEESKDVSQNRSNLIFNKIKKITLRTTMLNRRVGGSHLPLSQSVANSKSCINVRNTDDRCLEYSLLAYKCYDKVSINGKTNPNVYHKYYNEIKIPENQQYPIDIIEDIPKYEDLNKLRIMVYVIRDGLFHIEYKSERKYEETVNLYLIEDEDTDKNHFAWVRNISRFRNHLSTDKKHKKYDCDNCYCKSFKKQEQLDEHQKLCLNNKRCKVELPKEGQNIMKFIHDNHEFKHPFDIQADFESTLLKVSKRDDEKDSIENKSTNVYQKHIPNSFGLKYNCIHEEYSEPIKVFNNSNPEKVCEEWIKELERLAKKSYDLTKQNRSNIIWKDEEKEIHKNNTQCEKCQKKYTKENYKVAHHDHINGSFISSMCNECNLKYQYKRFLPVYLHNLKGYDSHLFIRSLFYYGYKQDDGDNHEIISCIPNNEEKYISFSKKIKVDEYINKDNKIKPVMFEISVTACGYSTATTS